MSTLERRFHEKVHREPMTGCWLWGGALTPKGYGQIRGDGPLHKRLGAHAVSWELHVGPIAPGLFVCHKCDVRWCVNPEHLFVGTVQDNVDDMWTKGRARPVFGEAASQAAFTDDDVRGIVARRLRGDAVRDIAEDAGVTIGTVYHILSGRTWRHATGLPRRHKPTLRKHKETT
jgi:hypothetical protein